MNKLSILPIAIVGLGAMTMSPPANAVIEFDQDVTPNVIYGSGNSNGFFTTDRQNGVELGLRAKIPYVGTTNSNGDGTYSYSFAEMAPCNFSWHPYSCWNFDWSVNTDFDDGSGFLIDDLTYELGVDTDPGPGVSFYTMDPITPPAFFDHSFGDNSTPNGGGTEAADPTEYLTLLTTKNVLQQSWRHQFLPVAYDPGIPGTYAVYLLARNSVGAVVARTEIQVLIEGAPPAPVPTINKEITSSNDVVVAMKPGAPHEYEFAITYDHNGVETPVMVVDTLPAEWIAQSVETISIDVSDCGDSDEADGTHGLVDVYKNGKPGKKCKSATTLEWLPEEHLPPDTQDFDADVTPEVIMGSGIGNGGWTLAKAVGIELGLRTKQRFPAANIFNSNGDGTYSWPATLAAPPNKAAWSFEWSINSDEAAPAGTGNFIADFTYELGIDTDTGLGTTFTTYDIITPPDPLWWDHAIGDNTTVNGGGAVAVSLVDYNNLITSKNVAQNSWQAHWFFGPSFDPTTPGIYDIYLSASDGDGEVARSTIQVIVGEGSTANTLDVAAATRMSPGKGHKEPDVYAPTSCGALYLNDGAVAYEVDEFGDLVLDGDLEPIVVAGPSNSLCLAVVDPDLLPGGGYDADADHDADNLASFIEACAFGSDPCVTDSDGDGLNDGEEYATMCTDPWVKDTDNDGLEDGEEVHTYFTDPCDDDSDDDGMLDGAEVAYDCSAATDPGAIANLDPNNPDSDGDNLSDGTDEGAIGTNPCDPDTDDDLVQDDVDQCPLDGDAGDGVDTNGCPSQL